MAAKAMKPSDRPKPIKDPDNYKGPVVKDRYGNTWAKEVWDKDLGPIFKGIDVTPDMTVYEKLDEARALLLDKREYLAHNVHSLMAPKVTKAIPTAAVASNKFGGIEFYFNPDFLKSLSCEEVAFVMSHEAMHVIARHVATKKDNHVLWNICCDVMVNTWLESFCELNIGPELKEMTWDADKIGYDKHELVHYLTADDLYDNLEPDVKRVQQLMDAYAQDLMSGDMKEMDGDGMPIPMDGKGRPMPGKSQGKPQKGEGNGSGEPQAGENPQNPETHESSGQKVDGTPTKGNGNTGSDPDKGDTITNPGNNAGATGPDEHKGWDGISEGACDSVVEELKNSGSFKKAQQAGKMPAGLARAFEEVVQDFSWERELERFIATRMKEVTTWERPNRRTTGAFPDFIVPGSKKKHLYNIVVYADMSGSIGPDEVARFVAVLQRAPKEVHFDCYSFDTQIYAWPGAMEGEMPRGGGGTSFQTVVNHCEQTHAAKKKFDGAVVLTDGYDAEPTVKKPSLWMWITTAAFPGGGYGQEIQNKKNGSFASGYWTMMPDTGPAKHKRR